MYKEIQLAVSNKYGVEIICFDFNNWSKEINERLKLELGNIHIISIPAGRTPFLPWCWSVLTETVYRILGKFLSLPVPVLSQAVSRRSNLLIKEFNKISKPDWVIGHNTGALWPAVKAARKFNCAVGFDVEDYHPGEGHNIKLQALVRNLIKRLLPEMNYVSFASPLIREQVQKDTGSKEMNWVTVLNYFPAIEFKEPRNTVTGPVKMVWFSQNINAGRGLELVLPIVKAANGALELQLIGHTDLDFYNKHLKDIANIIIHPPMAQQDLHHSLAQFDIGLALEPAKDKNNELAISNKILAYLQAGLFVLATNTPAQEKLFEEFPGHGVCFGTGTSQVQEVFKRVVEQVDVIRSNRVSRYEAFAGNNWEAASLELLKRWEGENRFTL